MALDDLSNVTQTLIRLLQYGIGASAAWGGAAPVVSPLPPDMMSTTNDLGFYLYHIAEDAHYKNNAPNEPTTRPLALNLYYQLTAQVGSDAAGAWRSQLLMSCALRVFHDHPVITDASVLTGTVESSDYILDWLGLRNRQNRLRIALRPVPADDAVDYWTAGQAPLRLAAYYQVSVVLLEPEPATTTPFPVLNYGSTVFATGAPMLFSSKARLDVVVGTDTAASPIVVQPAQVPLGTSTARTTFELLGTGLSGLGTDLRVRNQRGTFTVDATAWGLVASNERLLGVIAEWAGSVRMAPGIWSASVVVRRGTAAGSVGYPSNETPIVVCPRLDATSPTGPTLGPRTLGAPITVTGWLFRDDINTGDDKVVPDFTTDPGAVKLYVGEATLTRIADGGAPASGEFAVTGEDTLVFTLAATAQPGAVLPVRVSVNETISAPLWLEVTT